MASGPLQAATEIMRQGGPVMWPILGLSVISVAMSVERALFWLSTDRPGRLRRLTALASRLRAGDAAGARATVAADASVYASAVETLLDRGPSDAAALEAVEAIRPSIERFSGAQSTIITVAPMLGILGTVTGIIEAFNLLGTVSGSVSDPTMVAGGIAEALLTTAFGLIVAMLALFPYAFFRAKSDRALSRLEVLTAAAMQGFPARTAPAGRHDSEPDRVRPGRHAEAASVR